jgi:hypothetical protein
MKNNRRKNHGKVWLSWKKSSGGLYFKPAKQRRGYE